MPDNAILIIEQLPVAGWHFGSKLLPPKGEILKLVPDPENIHDNCAVKVEYADKQLGWIPKNYNKIPFRLLMAGWELFAVIKTCNPNVPYNPLEMDIFAVRNQVEKPDAPKETNGGSGVQSVHPGGPPSTSGSPNVRPSEGKAEVRSQERPHSLTPPKVGR